MACFYSLIQGVQINESSCSYRKNHCPKSRKRAPVERHRRKSRCKQRMGNRCLLRPDETHRSTSHTVAQIFDLSDSERKWLMQVPYKGSLPTEIPTDPLIYRLYELVNVYGTTIKELIHEEFGDGIMSAIDFDMDIQREHHQDGDRVKITMNGKFLPYKEY